MRITVTQEHIDTGWRGRAYQCPVALAIHEETGISFSVGCITAAIYSRRESKITLPQSAQDFIRDFDCQFPVGPFSFEFNFTPKIPPLTKPERTEPYGISEHDLG